MSPASVMYSPTPTDYGELDFRPTKRIKVETVVPIVDEVEAETPAIPPHPLGIKPAGNAYAAASNLGSASGLFCRLPDELLIQILEFLDAPALLSLGGTCKALYAFAAFEDLWKTLFIK